MQNLSFLHNLEVAQKFVVEEPKIILRRQRLYGVERDFSDQLERVHSEMKISSIMRFNLMIMPIVFIFFQPLFFAGRRVMVK